MRLMKNLLTPSRNSIFMGIYTHKLHKMAPKINPQRRRGDFYCTFISLILTAVNFNFVLQFIFYQIQIV